MDIAVHIQRVENTLSSKPGVVRVENPKIKRLPGAGSRAVIKARLTYFDNSFLDFYEIVDTDRCYPQHIRYSYQYLRNDERVFRYDNAPHHRDVDTFPHHKHIGSGEDERIIASQRPSHSVVFKEVEQYLANRINR